jgi:hypothetical protein
VEEVIATVPEVLAQVGFVTLTVGVVGFEQETDLNITP